MTTSPAAMFDAVSVATVTVALVAPALADSADDTLPPEDGLVAWLLRSLAGRAHQSLQEYMAHPDSTALELAFREDLVTHLRQQPELISPLAALLPAERLAEVSPAPPIQGDGEIGKLTHGQ